jgi:nucleotide-binding universal stress UspA family protein
MSLEKIVVAYDGSKDSKKALEWAINLAHQTAAKVTILSICATYTHASLDTDTNFVSLANVYKDQIQQDLRQVQEEYCNKGESLRAVLREGNPAHEIIAFAREDQADLIVCGSRGLGGFADMLLGGVAHKLVTYATMPVAVVK